MNKRRLAFLFALLLLPVIAWAGINLDGYASLTPADTPPVEQIAGVASADALTIDTPIANRRQITAGNTTVCVQVDFSGASGDTLVVTFIPYHVSTSSTVTRMPGLQTATATAGTYTDAAGDNVAPALFFEIPSGATDYEIRHAQPSAGNVDLNWIAYSADPQ